MPNRETEEKRRHSTAYIPYSCYECRIPCDFANVPLHWHSELEINYILQGEGEFICGNDRFHGKEGDILIILPNMLHAAYPEPEGNLIYQAFVFHPGMLGAGMNDRCAKESVRPLLNGDIGIRRIISGEVERYTLFRACTEQILACAAGDVPHGDLLLKSELMKLFWLLETDGESTPGRKAKADYGEIIRPALEYMIKNFEKNISVEELAEAVHLSKSYFMSCFKRSAGVSAVEYLIQLRVGAACEAISSTEKRISDIAFDCGYSNLSNFNRQFKRVTGYSPKEYRKQMRGRPQMVML